MKVLPLRSAAGGALAIAVAFGAPAANVTFTTTSIGGNSYQFEYTVTSSAGDPTFSELTVYVDTAFTNLTNPIGTTAWSPIVVPASPLLGDGPSDGDGFFDVVTTGAGLAPGSTLTGLTFEATYTGTGAPTTSQYYTLVNPNTLAIVQSGYATAVSAPVVTVNASATTVNSGQTVTLTAAPTGVGPFTYQWYQGASGNTTTPVAGATSATLTTPTLTGNASYWVETIGANGVVEDSGTITITVLASSGETDAPMPTWAIGALGIGLLQIAFRRRKSIDTRRADRGIS